MKTRNLLVICCLLGGLGSSLWAQRLPFQLDLSLTQGAFFSTKDQAAATEAEAIGLTNDYAYRRRTIRDFHDLSVQLGVLPFRKVPQWRLGLLHQRSDQWASSYSLWAPNSQLEWKVQRDRKLWGVWAERRWFPVSAQLYHRWEGSTGLGVNAMRSAASQRLHGFNEFAGFRFVEIEQVSKSVLLYGVSFRSSIEYYLAPFLSFQGRMDAFWFPPFTGTAPQPNPPLSWVDGPIEPYPVQMSSLNLLFGFHFHFR